MQPALQNMTCLMSLEDRQSTAVELGRSCIERPFANRPSSGILGEALPIAGVDKPVLGTVSPDIDNRCKPARIVERAYLDRNNIRHCMNVQQHWRTALRAKVNFQLSPTVPCVLIALEFAYH
jgi:hypothetical protein